MPKSSRRAGTVASSLLMFTVVSAVCGLLVAGLVMPLVGAATYGSKAAVGQLDNLPVEFDPPAQSQRTKVLDGNGDVLAYFYAENRVYVGLDKIAPVMRQAIVAIEDHRFYEHGPIDATGTLRAFLRNQAAGGVTQGGSSITQQYVKMVQIEKANQIGDEKGIKEAQEGTYSRKIQELRYAISLERKLSKDQILERYLNIAYFGNGAYGVEAAAQYYFASTAAKLTLPQAAMLAGLVQNPNVVNPVADASAALDRRDVVLNRMAELQIVSVATANKAKKQGFNAKAVRPTRNGCLGTEYPFMCDYVYKTLAQTPSLGATVADRENTIKRGGLTITTAIDPETQDVAQKAVSKVVGATDPLISTMNMVEPGTGLIVAMAQSRPVMGGDAKKGETYWNYSVSPALGGAQGFQAGSTFKAFTAAAALEKGTPARPALQRAAHHELRWRALRELRRTPADRRRLEGQQLHRHQRRDEHEPGRPALGQHLLRPAGAGHRDVPGHRDGREARRREQHRVRSDQLLRRQAVLHPRHGRGQPAVDGRGVRDVRLRRYPLQPGHRRHDHHHQG